MNRKRRRQWLAALRLEQRSAGRLPWLTMFLALLSGPVPKPVWVGRLRTCMKCPLYSTHQLPGTTKRTDRLHLCKSVYPGFEGLGCHCPVNVSAMTAEPYPGGCWVRAQGDQSMGWGAYRWPSWMAKLRAIVRFILDIRF